jgi:hypothetical protein
MSLMGSTETVSNIDSRLHICKTAKSLVRVESYRVVCHRWAFIIPDLTAL